MASPPHPWLLRETRRHWPLMSVLLVALLASSRKFVVLDAAVTGPATVAALAWATLVPGLVYWLLRERDDRVAPDRPERDGIE